MSVNNSLKDKRVIVTGGAGFIGSHLVKKLLDSNNQVVVLDNLSSGIFENLPVHSQLTFINGDIRDSTLTKKLVENSDVIFHLAEFLPNTRQFGPGHVVKFSMENPFFDLDNCVRGTLNVLEAAKEANVKVVFTSSAAVYGDPVEVPIKETTPPNPVSCYGASKLAAETYCKVYSKTHNLPVVIVRLFNIYGPRQRKCVMHDVLSKLSKNPNALTMLGSGDQERDFVYVDDAVEGLILLSVKEEATGQIFNLGTGISTSIKEVVTHIVRILGAEPVVTYTGSSWKGDVGILVADSTKVRGIGFTPKYSVEQGIKEFVSWYQHAEN
jgi:UDP-glucose 4-epimerase